MVRSRLKESLQTLALGSESAPTKAITDPEAGTKPFSGLASRIAAFDWHLPVGRSRAKARCHCLNSLRIIGVRNGG
jgi:hypothetical protein